MLAKYGYRVTVLESHYLPGGAAHSFEVDGYKFGERGRRAVCCARVGVRGCASVAVCTCVSGLPRLASVHCCLCEPAPHAERRALALARAAQNHSADAGPSFHMGLVDERSSNPLKQVGGRWRGGVPAALAAGVGRLR